MLAPYKKGSTASAEIVALLKQQCATWELAGRNFAALSGVQEKVVEVAGFPFTVQFNPARIQSSAAKVDVKSIQERKCFLCLGHLPAEQKGIAFAGISSEPANNYMVLCNPFPIFTQHFTIPDVNHVDQRIVGRVGDMLHLASEYDQFVFFYNGPKCGASAPDHMHFQAGNKGFLPLEHNFALYTSTQATLIAEREGVRIESLKSYPVKNLIFRSSDATSLVVRYEAFMADFARIMPEELEPMVNLLAWKEQEELVLLAFPRKLHRPSQFFAEGDENLLISPASVDLGGVFITPQEKDYRKIGAADIADILAQISVTEEMFVSLTQAIQG